MFVEMENFFTCSYFVSCVKKIFCSLDSSVYSGSCYKGWKRSELQHCCHTGNSSRHCIFSFIHQAPVVQTSDSAIHRINHYPADSVIDFRNTYPLDSDLSGG